MKEVMNENTFLSRSRILVVVFVFIGAFLLRTAIIVFLEPDRPIESDGKYYYETAVNLANGNGYTWDGSNPFFFREPGVIYFYAGCLKVFMLINNIETLKKSDSSCKLYMWTLKQKESRHSILFIRIIQAFLQSLTIVLFYLVIKRYVNTKIALITFITLSIFPPYFFHVFSILREILVAFLIMSFTYIWVLYLENRKYWKIIMLGIIWGFVSLTFQVYIILGGVIIVYLIVSNLKTPIETLKPVSLFLFASIITVTPWISKVYHYYPDIRILKTLGISMTHEQNKFLSALSNCDNKDLLKKYSCNFFQDECEMDYRHIMWYGESSKIHFEKSFNGTYTNEANLLESLTSKERKIKSFIYDIKNKVRQSFFRFGTENLIWVYFGHFIYWKIIYYIIGILAFLGILFNLKNFTNFSLVYYFHIGLFIVIGSEARRMLPIQPFMIFFFIITLMYILKKVTEFKLNTLKNFY